MTNAVADARPERHLRTVTDTTRASIFGPVVLAVAALFFIATLVYDLARGTQAELYQYMMALGFTAIAIER